MFSDRKGEELAEAHRLQDLKLFEEVQCLLWRLARQPMSPVQAAGATCIRALPPNQR